MPTLKNIGNCKVEVYPNEGYDIPHFHITSISKGNKKENIDCCVMINKASFFEHDVHRSKLTSKQCKELDEWLKKKCEKQKKNELSDNDKNNGETRWERIQNLWEASKGNKYHIDKKPDYTKMSSYSSK